MRNKKVNREEECKRFKELGIPLGISFRIKELTGWYMVDTTVRQAFDTTNGKSAVNGLYEHLLDGTWHRIR